MSVQATLPHSHHWQIATPEGAMSLGTYRHCGETRMFRNSTEGYDFIGHESGRKEWHRQSDRHYDDWTGQWAS